MVKKMKIFRTYLILIALSLAVLLAKPVFAVSIDDVIEPRVQRSTFLQAALGNDAGKSFDAYLDTIFNYNSILGALHITNWISTILIAVFLLTLLTSVTKMMTYAKVELGWFKRFKLLHVAVKKNPADFFVQYCGRTADGTFDCSYSEHKTYHKASRISLHGSFYAIGAKVAIISLIFLFQGGFFKAFAGRESSNYNIFADSYTSGGHATSTGGYKLDDSFGEPVQGVAASSANYFERAGFIASDRDATISLTLPPEAELTFGELSYDQTAYSTHTMSVAYSGAAGYDLYVRNDPPTRVGGAEVITPIGATPASPVLHTTQYGINLASNTIPASVGAAPVGGSGQVDGSYGVTNSYAFLKDDIIAYSNGASTETVFTITAIMNFSTSTPAGTYTTTMTYELVPRF